jgi:hypothetical protein
VLEGGVGGDDRSVAQVRGGLLDDGAVGLERGLELGVATPLVLD